MLRTIKREAFAIVVAGLAWSFSVAATEGDTRAISGAPFERRYTAADYNATPSQYGVATDAEGRLFVANVEGLLRFSAGRFELFPLPNKAQVEAVVIGADGRAYFGGYDYFGCLEESPTGEARFRDLTPNFRLPPDESGVGQVWTMVWLEDRVYVQTDERIFVIQPDGHGDSFKSPAKTHRLFVADGAIYVRLDGVGLTRIEGQEFKPIPGADTFKDLGVTYVERRPDGDLLILSRDKGFFEGNADGVKPLATKADVALESLESFTALRLPDGDLMIATPSGDLLRLGADLGLIHRYQVSSYPLTDLALDQQGGLWVATQGDLVRLAVPSPWSVFTDADGLTGALADSVVYQGRRWVSSTVGLQRSHVDAEGRMRFEKLPWTSYEVWDLEATRSGLLYAGRDALKVVVDDKPQVVAEAQFPSQINVSRFNSDRIYVPFEPGFIVLNQTASGWKEAGRFEPEGMSVGGIVETAPGDLWLGNNRGAPQRVKLSVDGSRLLERQVLGEGEGLPAQGKVSYPVEVDDRLLMVMNDHFFAWDGKRFAPSDAGGLAELITRPDELTVRTAPDGTRYAFTSRELLVRKPNERAWRRLPVESSLIRGFTQLSVEGDGSFSLISWNALVSYDPAVKPPEMAPLKTKLFRVKLHEQDNGTKLTKLLDRHIADLSVPPHRSIEVEFGLDSADPTSEYRSQLEGLESDYGEWSKLNRREFTSLAPGEYKLRVEARTETGRIADPLTWSFHVEPRWYQTVWARTASVLLLVASCFAIARLYAVRRLRLVKMRNRALKQLVEDRTRGLMNERQKSQALLQNILPTEVITELQNSGSSPPRRYESATVLFTDFVGFTNTVSSIPADFLVEELNEIFAAFDEIIDRNGVEKIKTVGDAYLIVGGVPTPCDNHAERCVRTALEMQAFMAGRNKTASIKWLLRCGLHTGPVVAGVVGKRKYTYDVWGDTVNIASRMESSDSPGRINLSASTHAKIRTMFDCEYRGKISAKGKGDLDMYFVALSGNGDNPSNTVVN